MSQERHHNILQRERERVESQPEIPTERHISPTKDGKLLMILD